MFYFILLCTFFAFLLPPIVEVDISNIAIISGITNMVKAIILVINNTPQKTYRIAQYTDSRNRLDPLTRTHCAHTKRERESERASERERGRNTSTKGGSGLETSQKQSWAPTQQRTLPSWRTH